MRIAVSPIALGRSITRKAPFRAAAAITCLLATSLHAVAAAQEETPKPLIVKAEDGFLVKSSISQHPEGISIHEFVVAAAWGADRIIFWDTETEELLRKRRMRLEGQKTVPDARFVPFLQTTLLLADFLCVEHGEGETKVIQILPLGVAESTAAEGAEGDELLGVEEDHYVLDFGATSSAKSTTLFELAVSCTGVEGMQFTWSLSTEELLKDRHVRLCGKRRIPKHQLQSFFTTMMSISDFSCATFGDGEIKVIRVQPSAESFANEPGEIPTSTPSLKEPVVLTFGTRTIAESTSLMELAWTCQKTTGRVLSWNQATDALLSEQRMRIVGTRSMQGPGFLPLFESLLTASNYSWEEVTTDVGPRIKIEAL